MKKLLFVAMIIFLGQALPQAQNLRFSNLQKAEDGILTVWFYVENISSDQAEVLKGFNLRYYYNSRDLEFIDFNIEEELMSAGFLQMGGDGDHRFVQNDVTRYGKSDRYVGYAPRTMSGGFEIPPQASQERKPVQIATLKFRMLTRKSLRAIEAYQVPADLFRAMQYTGLPGCEKGCDVILVDPPSAREANVIVTDFTGIKLGLNDSKLIWQTEGEDLVDFYTIERRPEGASDWQEIANVPVASVVHGQRTFVDRGVYSGIENKATYEYRIKLNFKDADQGLTDIESIVFSKTKRFVEVYPNPASNEIHIQLDPVMTENDLNLMMYDAQGKAVFSRDIARDSKYEYINLQKMAAASGTYSIQLWDNSQLLDVYQIEVIR